MEEPKRGWGGKAVSLVKGGVLAFLITMAAVLLCAVLISGGWVEMNGALRAAPLLCVPGCIAGAVVSGGGRREWAVGAALSTGIVLFLLLAALGSALRGSLPDGTALPPVLAACVGSGAVVGVLGRGKRKKKRRKHL